MWMVRLNRIQISGSSAKRALESDQNWSSYIAKTKPPKVFELQLSFQKKALLKKVDGTFEAYMKELSIGEDATQIRSELVEKS
jgi:hypothetical protein